MARTRGPKIRRDVPPAPLPEHCPPRCVLNCSVCKAEADTLRSLEEFEKKLRFAAMFVPVVIETLDKIAEPFARDQIALAAMREGIAGHARHDRQVNPDVLAANSYQMADAMLKARKVVRS